MKEMTPVVLAYVYKFRLWPQEGQMSILQARLVEPVT